MAVSLDKSGITTDASGTHIAAQSIPLYRMTVIASGAALYLNTGMKANRAYTPTRMRDALNDATGSKARNLKAALAAYVTLAAEQGCPVTNPQVLRAIE